MKAHATYALEEEENNSLDLAAIKNIRIPGSVNHLTPLPSGNQGEVLKLHGRRGSLNPESFQLGPGPPYCKVSGRTKYRPRRNDAVLVSLMAGGPHSDVARDAGDKPLASDNEKGNYLLDDGYRNSLDMSPHISQPRLPQEAQHISPKSRRIFTPIDERRSTLSQDWASSNSQLPPPTVPNPRYAPSRSWASKPPQYKRNIGSLSSGNAPPESRVFSEGSATAKIFGPSYLPKPDANYMRDFACCGQTLPTMDDLLQHCEELHAGKTLQSLWTTATESPAREYFTRSRDAASRADEDDMALQRDQTLPTDSITARTNKSGESSIVASSFSTITSSFQAANFSPGSGSSERAQLPLLKIPEESYAPGLNYTTDAPRWCSLVSDSSYSTQSEGSRNLPQAQQLQNQQSQPSQPQGLKSPPLLEAVSTCAESVRPCDAGMKEEITVGTYLASRNVQSQLDKVLQQQKMIQKSIDAAHSKTHLLDFLMEQLSMLTKSLALIELPGFS